ncbi:MAG: nicotinamidase [bacterium]|nr:nicotinamidase [bacterium]
MATALPLPRFYDPKNARLWGYRPDLQATFVAATEARKRLGVKPAASSKTRVHVVGIDWNKDFCFPEGTLYVAGRSGTGAMDDAARFAEFLYRNAGLITDVTMTMDTHFLFQIFFPSFWLDANGDPLTPHTLVVAEGGLLVNKGLDGKTIHASVLPNPAMAPMLGVPYEWLCKQARFYCEELTRGGKYVLYLWPYHCILGTDGHALSGVVAEAHAYVSFLRGRQSLIEVKGGNPLTENYSVLRPEVLLRYDGKGAIGQKNTAFIETLMTSDIVVFGGEAASHCVSSSIDDFLGEILAKDAALAKKVYILEDCMSAVTVPDGKGGFAADFTPQADAALDKFRKAGMHVVKSTDPIETWPGVSL